MSDNNEASSKSIEEKQLAEKVGENVNSPMYEKSQFLVDIANNTFKELCRTLENEQTKLIELEERRKKLQEEMQRLKMEIEEEKKSYHPSVVDVTADNLELISPSSSTNVTEEEPIQTESVKDFIERQQADMQKICGETMLLHQLDTCFEVDENNDDDDSVDSDSKSVRSVVDHAIIDDIQEQLQAVASECIIEHREEDELEPSEQS